MLLRGVFCVVFITQLEFSTTWAANDNKITNSSIPVTVPVRGIQSNSIDSCLSDDQRQRNRADSRQEIVSILRDRIVPSYCEVGGSKENAAESCSEIPQECSSGWYWVQTPTGDTVRVYCELSNRCGCNTTDEQQAWMRVAYFDMTDPDQHCPEGLRYVENPKRSCRKHLGSFRVSLLYQTYGMNYSRVCGRIRAYQLGTTDAFYSQYYTNDIAITYRYVDGVSVTTGSPESRQHIWTFASGFMKSATATNRKSCPCRNILNTTLTTPPFVGDDYFCESGTDNRAQGGQFYAADPLWDGQGCATNSECCSFNNPPWFCKKLPISSSEDIEIRLLTATGHSEIEGEDTPIELLEIYVQ